MRFRLRWKILLLAVVAPLILGAGSLRLVENHLSRKIRSEIDDALHRSSLVCTRVLDSRSRLIESSARVIAEDPRFFASLAIRTSSQDAHYRATARNVARTFNKVANADIFEVLDPAGRLVASAGAIRTTESTRGGLPFTGDGEPVCGLLAQADTLFLACRTPVRAGGRTIGSLLLAERIGDQLAGELREMTRCEISFLTEGGYSGTTLATADEREVLADTLRGRRASGSDPLRAGIFAVPQAGVTYLTLVGAPPGSPPDRADVVVLQRSLEEETAFLRDIQGGLAKLGLLTLLATLLLGLLVSHKITRPILQLVRGAEEIETGNYEYPLRIRSRDEIGYLARRFEAMREHERSYIQNLQDVARLKSNFVSVASHELRTPTSVIMGYADLLLQGDLGEVTAEQKSALEAITSHVRAIVKIADDATSIAQIEDKRQSLDCQPTDLRSIVEEAVDIARAESTARRLTVTVDAPDQPLWTEVDRACLVQAIVHLVKNAIRFTSDGGAVGVQVGMEGPELVVRVSDTGVGISPERCARLLEGPMPLRDARHHHSSTELEFGSAGLGLGIPIARSIVEAHGGSITVASQEGEGSVFTIRLPGAEPPEIAQAA